MDYTVPTLGTTVEGSEITIPVTLGSGDENLYGISGSDPNDALIGRFAAGTSGTPQAVVGPLVKIDKTENILISAGMVNGQTVEQSASLVVTNSGPATNEAQVTGIWSLAKTSSTVTAQNDDSCAVVGIGQVDGSGTGYGIGGYFVGKANTNTGHAYGVEGRVWLNRSADGSYTSNGASDSMAFWASVSTQNGAALVGAAYSMGRAGTGSPQFEVGYAVPGFATTIVRDEAFRDDSNAVTSLLINGAHTDGVDLSAATFTGDAVKLAATHTLKVGTVSSRIGANGLRPAGSLYETIERGSQTFTNAAVLVSQRLSMCAIWLPAGLTVTSISVLAGATSLGVGVHQLFGLYDDALGSTSGTARALLRGSTDDTNVAWSGNTVKTLGLTSTYKTTRSGLFYIGVLVDAGTVPTLYGGGTLTAGIQLIAPYMAGTSSTTVTALPDPAGAITTTANMFYAYVN